MTWLTVFSPGPPDLYLTYNQPASMAAVGLCLDELRWRPGWPRQVPLCLDPPDPGGFPGQPSLARSFPALIPANAQVSLHG